MQITSTHAQTNYYRHTLCTCQCSVQPTSTYLGGGTGGGESLPKLNKSVTAADVTALTVTFLGVTEREPLADDVALCVPVPAAAVLLV
jgi:hypothetical protein